MEINENNFGDLEREVNRVIKTKHSNITEYLNSIEMYHSSIKRMFQNRSLTIMTLIKILHPLGARVYLEIKSKSMVCVEEKQMDRYRKHIDRLTSTITLLDKTTNAQLKHIELLERKITELTTNSTSHESKD